MIPPFPNFPEIVAAMNADPKPCARCGERTTGRGAEGALCLDCFAKTRLVQVTFDPAHLVVIGGGRAICAPSYWTATCATGQFAVADTRADAVTMLAHQLGLDPSEITASDAVSAES